MWTENSYKIGPFNEAMRLIKRGILGKLLFLKLGINTFNDKDFAL